MTRTTTSIQSRRSRVFSAAIGLLLASTAVGADTLVLRDGRRVEGELIGVFGREIEFEERDGRNRRVVRVARRDIARIEFDGSDRRDDGDLAGGVPRGMRERQVSVSARAAWIDTGIDVRRGQEIYIQSTGETRWGPNRRDGASGERNSPFNANRPLPDRPAAALLGRIGEQDVFFIGGETGPFRVRANGRLFLGINDDVLTDNSGALRVTVSY